MGVPVVAGREFTAADGPTAPPVAMVNEAFVRKFDLGDDVLGRGVGFGGNTGMEIVGVVRDAKYHSVKDDPPPMVYLPYAQESRPGMMSFYVRTAADPGQLMRAIPGTIAAIDPNLPVERLKSMPQQVREQLAIDRLTGILSAAFALLATLLASIGLYGVIAHMVVQRTREIGVRMALGAGGDEVRGMVLRHVMRMLAVGAPLGIAAALLLGRAVESILYGLDGTDPLTVLAGAGTLVLVALVAGFVPALRASRVNPLEALRYD
jgi:putative ABC transport system permease protein